jgi:hypothetical protein
MKFELPIMQVPLKSTASLPYIIVSPAAQGIFLQNIAVDGIPTY